MNKNNIKITIFKELRGIVRDRKSLMLLLLMPLFIPFFIFFYGYLYNDMDEKEYEIGANYHLSNDELQSINGGVSEMRPITKLIVKVYKKIFS